MNVYNYIATQNPNQANDLLTNYGFQKTKDINVISKRLGWIVKENRTSALKDISEIHPDKKLIMSFNETKENYLNLTGRTPEISSEDLDEKLQSVVNTTKEALNKVISKIDVNNRRNNRKNTNRPNNEGKVSQQQMLVIGIAFAIGYMLGNK